MAENVKQFLWPTDPQQKTKRKSQYKNIGLFLVATAILIKFNREVADLIYNQTMLEEAIRTGNI